MNEMTTDRQIKMTTNIQPQDTSTTSSETRATVRTNVLDRELSRPLTSYTPDEIEVETKNLNLFYGKKQALSNLETAGAYSHPTVS